MVPYLASETEGFLCGVPTVRGIVFEGTQGAGLCLDILKCLLWFHGEGFEGLGA